MIRAGVAITDITPQQGLEPAGYNLVFVDDIFHVERVILEGEKICF